MVEAFSGHLIQDGVFFSLGPVVQLVKVSVPDGAVVACVCYSAAGARPEGTVAMKGLVRTDNPLAL